jgi:hypothetical protein
LAAWPSEIHIHLHLAGTFLSETIIIFFKKKHETNT